MFPPINRDSFSALKRYCTRKDHDTTKRYLNKIWDREALSKMMMITYTSNIDDLTEWLVDNDNDQKLEFIKNSNLFY